MAKIVDLNLNTTEGYVNVTYDSGTIRRYKYNALPKSVCKFAEQTWAGFDIRHTLEAWGWGRDGLEPDNEPENEPENEPAFEDPFFKSEDAKAIFFLTQADGEMRVKALGIHVYLYRDPEKAKRWKEKYDEILKDSIHPMADKARAEVERIYQDMLPVEEEAIELENDQIEVDGFNPVEEYRNLMEEADEWEAEEFATEQLFGMLNEFFTVDSLHKLISSFHMDSQGRTRRWTDKKKLIDHIVSRSKARATQGDVFRNYGN